MHIQLISKSSLCSQLHACSLWPALHRSKRYVCRVSLVLLLLFVFFFVFSYYPLRRSVDIMLPATTCWCTGQPLLLRSEFLQIHIKHLIIFYWIKKDKSLIDYLERASHKFIIILEFLQDFLRFLLRQLYQ